MRTIATLLALIAALALAGCGGDDDESASTTTAPAASAADFPAADGKSIEQLTGSLPDGPVLAPTTSVYEPGETNRVAVGAFDVERKPVKGAAIALYLADADGSNARGPYLAKPQSLAVDAQYRSQQTAADLELNDTVYVAQVPLPARRGKYAIAGVAKLDGKTLAASSFPIEIRGGGPPSVGERAPKVDTPTGDDVAGDLSRIDTRVPPLPELHQVSAADTIGRQPTMLLFATPQLCSSRVCGPVNDITYQASAQPENKGIAFIHQEIYVDNQVSKGLRSQVRRYDLQTEPWAFLIDRGGVIRARFEGAFSAAELARALAKIR